MQRYFMYVMKVKQHLRRRPQRGPRFKSDLGQFLSRPLLKYADWRRKAASDAFDDKLLNKRNFVLSFSDYHLMLFTRTKMLAVRSGK